VSRRTLVLLLLLLVIVVPATAQNFALSVSPAPVCLSVGDARMRAAAPAERPDYTVRIGSAASADVRVGLAETIDEADFVFIEGTDPPRCPTSANRIVRIDATAPTPDLTLGFAAASLGALLIGGGTALAQPRPAQTGQTITTNFKDADITQIAEAVSAATGKNFIIDPRVRAQVTMLSSTPMSPAAFYEAFLAILQVHGFAAMPAGNVVKIVPDSSIRSMPGVDLPDNVSSTSDEIVTQVISVKNVSAAQLVPVLRPLVPQQGQLAAYVPSNITSTSAADA